MLQCLELFTLWPSHSLGFREVWGCTLLPEEDEEDDGAEADSGDDDDDDDDDDIDHLESDDTENENDGDPTFAETRRLARVAACSAKAKEIKPEDRDKHTLRRRRTLVHLLYCGRGCNLVWRGISFPVHTMQRTGSHASAQMLSLSSIAERMARQIHCRSLHHHLSTQVLSLGIRFCAPSEHSGPGNGSGPRAEGVAAASGIVLRCLGSHEEICIIVIVPSTVRSSSSPSPSDTVHTRCRWCPATHGCSLAECPWAASLLLSARRARIRNPDHSDDAHKQVGLLQVPSEGSPWPHMCFKFVDSHIDLFVRCSPLSHWHLFVSPRSDQDTALATIFARTRKKPQLGPAQ